MAETPWRLLGHLHLALLLLLWSNVNAQKNGEIGGKCLTPNGETGRCFSIFSCEAHKDILDNRPLTPKTKVYLRKSQCGLQGGLPFLCCPNSATTTVVKPLSAVNRLCGQDLPEKDGGDSRMGAVTTTPPSPTTDNGLDIQSSTSSPTAPTTRYPFRPLTPMERLERTLPDVVNHPNWAYLRNDICGKHVGVRTIEGEEASLRQYPWLAYLVFQIPQNAYKCGGAVISNRYVLTSAECVTGRKGARLVNVRLGEHNTLEDRDCMNYKDGTTECGPPVQVFTVTKSIAHPLYSSASPDRGHDIALIRLDRDIDFTGNYVFPICLPNGYDVIKRYEEESMVVAGWRWNEDNAGRNVKLWDDLPVVNNTVCQVFYKRKQKIYDSLICAGGIKCKDACRGDEGGPLMYAKLVEENKGGEIYVATGIATSRGDECKNEDKPGIYTRVGPYMNWILDNLEP